MSDKKGLDKEIFDRIQAKYDPALEQKAMDWIAALTNTQSPKVLGTDGATLFQYLKNGVILCKMLNSVSPGVVPSKSFTNTPRNMLEERGNIEQYLAGCRKLSIPSQDMFILSDLHSANSMSAVLQNIYSIGRQAQVIPGFKGPKLGVTFSVSIEEQQRRVRVKEVERKKEIERKQEVSQKQLKRRSELEESKREELIKDMEKNDIRKLHRQMSRGSISKKTFQKLVRENSAKFEELRNSNKELVSNSDIKYGMDIDIHEKRKQSYSLKNEDRAMDWIEKVTKEEVDDFYEDLKSGLILCKLANSIYPNIIKKVGTRDVPLVHRDNIQLYLSACTRMGLNSAQIFNVNDLYEKKDLQAVINNIFALGRKADVVPFYQGPVLAPDGKMNEKSKLQEPEENQSCRCSIQ